MVKRLEQLPHITSLLVHLQYAKAMEANDVLERLLEHPSALRKTADIVLQRIDSGIYFLDNLVASLVCHAQAKDLFEKTREKLLSNPRTLLILYKGKYPDASIETKLAEKLYEIFSNDAEPLRSDIVEAMQQVGSSNVVSLLEAILFELQPSVKVRTTFPEALGLVGSFEARSRSAFVDIVTSAIAVAKTRPAP